MMSSVSSVRFCDSTNTALRRSAAEHASRFASTCLMIGTALPASVPRHRRVEDQIAGLHEKLLALDDRVGAAAFDNKTKRAEVVPVAARELARLQELHRHLDRVRGRAPAPAR